MNGSSTSDAKRLIGLAVGILAAATLAPALRGVLFGVAPLDPVTFALIMAALPGTALVACLGPAWRASRLSPVEALSRD
jgi:ABC-type lipoprotein release transport system permease subunit